NEVSVDAIVSEETGPEEPLEQDEETKPRNNEWVSNRFLDAVAFYRHRLKSDRNRIQTAPVRIGIIERDVDFDAPEFADYLGDCDPSKPRTCVYARDAEAPDEHGTTVTAILAARNENPEDSGFLSALEDAGSGFEVIVERNSDAGITANIAASVNLVEDGARILNWSWGIHRIGTRDIHGDPVDSLLRAGIAMAGYEELLEEFFLWLRREQPDVVVANSAGNGAASSSQAADRLASADVTEQRFVSRCRQRRTQAVELEDPDYATRRHTPATDVRVDITAAGCTAGSAPSVDQDGPVRCGTRAATPLGTGV